VQEAIVNLHSDDLRKVAWGAWSAALNDLAPCVGELRARLVALAKVSPAQRTFVVRAVLDALIQIDAAVPVVELEPFLASPETMTHAFVLLVRRADENGPLLRQLFRSQSDTSLVWVASGNLLAAARDPEYVVDLLRSPVHLKVSVVDPGVLLQPIRSHTHERWGESVPDGYPPVTTYRLGSEGIKVADGPLPVRALRRTDKNGEIDFGTSAGYRSLRRMWFAHVLGDGAPDRLLDQDQWVEVEWSGAKEFLDGVQERRSEIERDFADLITACVKTKLVKATAVDGLRPVVEVQLDDRRKDLGIALPDVAASVKK